MPKSAVLFALSGAFLVGAIGAKLAAPKRVITLDEMMTNPGVMWPDRWEIAVFALVLLCAASLAGGFILRARTEPPAPPPKAMPTSRRGDPAGLGRLGPWLLVVFGFATVIGTPLMLRHQAVRAHELLDSLDGPTSGLGFGPGVIAFLSSPYVIIGLVMTGLGIAFLRRTN